MTNVQDRAVINTVSHISSGMSGDVEIGEGVTIGHGALLTSCVIGNHSLIGQGSIIQKGAEIGKECVIAAGAVVEEDSIIPARQLWAGNPAKYVRDVTEADIAGLREVSFCITAAIYCVFK